MSRTDVPRRIPRPKDHALIAARIRAGIQLAGRGPSPAELGAEAAARAAAHTETYANAAPRRPLNGHTADCPERDKGPVRRCRHCRAETLGQHRVNGVPVPASSVLSSSRVVSGAARNITTAAEPQVTPRARIAAPSTVDREPELRSCRGCCAPTTTDLCPKCENST